MKRNIFISYSHSDEKENMWLERLNGYLDGVKDQLPLKPWDDTKIDYGANWRNAIAEALANSSAAIFLVGRGFLASKFIKEQELPKLIPAGGSKSIKLYIVHVGYSPWKHSVLEPYQAFNDPDEPLEALDKPDQNKWLNKLVNTLMDDMKSMGDVTQEVVTPNAIKPAMKSIQEYLVSTKAGITTQLRRARMLKQSMEQRLGVTELLQFEEFFFRFYDQMTDEEHFQFDQIRALTDGVLYVGNKAILDLIEATPGLRDELPILGALKTHLIIWLNKYDRIFTTKKEMAVNFTGVEDGVPFPYGVDELVNDWLDNHQ